MGRTRRFAALLLMPCLALMASGCKDAGIANRCPGTPAPTCATRVICDMDHERGCNVCRCEAPPFAPVQGPPQGAPVMPQ